MSILDGNISILDVAELLKSNPEDTPIADIGAVCTHENINMWSRYKPIIHPIIEVITEQTHINNSFGIKIPEAKNTYTSSVSNKWEYLSPTGQSISPFRIDDFHNYNHEAPPIAKIIGDKEVDKSLEDFLLAKLTVNPNGGLHTLSFNDFSVKVGNYYYATIIKSGIGDDNLHIKTASTNISEDGFEFQLSFTEEPLSTVAEPVTLYHILVNTKIENIVKLNTLEGLLFISLPTDKEVSNITTLTLV